MSTTVANECIIKGTSNTINIGLKRRQDPNDPNSPIVPIDISGLSGLVIEIFQKNIPFDKFSLNAQVGFRSIDVINATEGKIRLYLNKGNTLSGIVGRDVFYEATTEGVNVNFDGGLEVKASKITLLTTLIDTKTVNDTFS